jgi:hypothetical protein
MRLSVQSLVTGAAVAASSFHEAYLSSYPAGLFSGRFSFAHYIGQQRVRHACDKEHLKCIVYLIPNDFLIADPARAAKVLSQGHQSLE